MALHPSSTWVALASHHGRITSVSRHSESVEAMASAPSAPMLLFHKLISRRLRLELKAAARCVAPSAPSLLFLRLSLVSVWFTWPN